MIDNYHHFGHYAVEGTFKRIWNDGFWHPDLRSRINSRISKCIECLKNNIVSNGYHPSWSIEANSIFDHIQVDLQGPFTKDLNNNCYLLTAIDVLSGFVVLKGLPDKTEESVSYALMEIFFTFGPPKILQHDGGLEFCNSVVSNLCKLLSVENRTISAYHPNSDGLVENSNKQVKDQLRKFLSADKGNISNWSKWISYIQFNINNHINSRTNSSAFSLMFARQPNRFIDYSNQKLNHKIINEIFEMNKTKNEVVIPSIVERSTSIKEKNRLDSDKRRKQIPELLPGQKVMLFDDARTDKLDPIYECPFEIVTFFFTTFSLLEPIK